MSRGPTEGDHEGPREATHGSATGDPGRRVEGIRRATLHSFPAPDIDQMLAEIESGYTCGGGSLRP